MNGRAKLAAAAAGLATLTACLCKQTADTTTVQVAQVPSATLSARYDPPPYDGAGFGVVLAVDADSPCDVLAPSATAEVSGIPLESEQDGQEACYCPSSRFHASGAEVPAAAEATFRVTDASGEMTATAPQLFVERAVRVPASVTELRVGTRVDLEIVPAGETMSEVTASFVTYGTAAGYRTLFTLRSSDGTIGRDATGHHFVVPDVAPGHGELRLSARAQVETSSCVGAGRCEVTASAEGSFLGPVVRP